MKNDIVGRIILCPWWIIQCALLCQSVASFSLRSTHWQNKTYSSDNLDPYLPGEIPSQRQDVSVPQRRILSSNCKSFRPIEDYYTAELQLFYVYSVEFASNAKSRSLTGMEAAITSSIMDTLVDYCDLLDRPMYKVKSSLRHQFSKDEFCVPYTEGNTCSVVDGATAILLDTRSANIQEVVYDAIASGLANMDLLLQFSPFVVRAEFQTALGETLLAAPDPRTDPSPGPITAAVAVAAASVSFLVASIFCYGLMRQQMLHHPEPSVRHKFRRRTTGHVTMAFRSTHSRPRRRFVRLDELSHPSDEDMDKEDDDYDCDDDDVEDYTHDPHPSITWSISDITSDSASHVSGVSWTTSRLERIEEGEEEDDIEELQYRKRKRSKWNPDSPPSQFPVEPVVEETVILSTHEHCTSTGTCTNDSTTGGGGTRILEFETSSALKLEGIELGACSNLPESKGAVNGNTACHDDEVDNKTAQSVQVCTCIESPWTPTKNITDMITTTTNVVTPVSDIPHEDSIAGEFVKMSQEIE